MQSVTAHSVSAMKQSCLSSPQCSTFLLENTITAHWNCKWGNERIVKHGSFHRSKGELLEIVLESVIKAKSWKRLFFKKKAFRVSWLLLRFPVSLQQPGQNRVLSPFRQFCRVWNSLDCSLDLLFWGGTAGKDCSLIQILLDSSAPCWRRQDRHPMGLGLQGSF